MRAQPITASRGEGAIGAIVGLVIFIVICVLIWNHLIVPAWDKHVMKYDKPWWSGNETQRVCDTSGEPCYTLVVASTGDEIETIYFPNGGYLNIHDTECFKNAFGSNRVCTVWDGEGRSFDVLQ